MTHRLRKPTVLAAGAAAAVGLMALASVGSGILVLAPGAGATSRSPVENPSDNVYYPLVLGSKWTYKYTSGTTAGSTYTISVLGAHSVAGGEAVDMRFGTSSGAVDGQYTIESDGSIEVQASFGGSKTSGSVSGEESYYIPTVAQVTSCAPCRFTGSFSATVAGTSVLEHLVETLTSLGAHPVAVPAGHYTAEELHMVLVLKGSGAYGFTTTISYDLYLAKNVGMVEVSAGTLAETVVGHKVDVATGAEQLLHYTT